MRNIHLIHVNRAKASLYHCSNTRDFFTTEQTSGDLLYELYITSDEKPKAGDWSLYQNKIHKCIEDIVGDEFKKIILTTDQSLDGVQAIDDEFLEWFVNNPSCEFVEIVDDWNSPRIDAYEYKIIIPQEESKQETLEEFIEREGYPKGITQEIWEDGVRLGAKWQQEQDRWKTVYQETPPIHVELLVQSPEGIIHLASWRESYNIFTCQHKSESSSDWKWKTI